MSPALIKESYSLQLGTYFSRLHCKDDVVYATSDFHHSCIWNHAFSYKKLQPLTPSQLNIIENAFTLTDRRAAFYLHQDDVNKTLLLERGYTVADNECWMRAPQPSITKPPDSKESLLKKVLCQRSLNAFLEILISSFGPSYAEAVTYEFSSSTNPHQISHYLYYESGEAVGIASLYSSEILTVIHNVAVAQQHRRNGIGKRLMQGLQSEKQFTQKNVFLQCDGDTYIETFYQSLNYIPELRRLGLQHAATSI